MNDDHESVRARLPKDFDILNQHTWPTIWRMPVKEMSDEFTARVDQMILVDAVNLLEESDWDLDAITRVGAGMLSAYFRLMWALRGAGHNVEDFMGSHMLGVPEMVAQMDDVERRGWPGTRIRDTEGEA